MRNIILASISALSLTLSGCGGSDSKALGDTGAEVCFNTALPFIYERETFVVEDNIERTSSWDYLKSIQPNPTPGISDDVQSIVTFMEDKFKQFTVYTGPAGSITSINNALDTMEEVITNNEVGNIQAGREQIVQNITDSNTCKYLNNGIILKSAQNTNASKFILGFNYSSFAEQVTQNVIEFVTVLDSEGNPAKDKNGNEITNTVATLQKRYNAPDFTASGYNAPTLTFAQWFNAKETLQITKNYLNHFDFAEYFNQEPFTVGTGSSTYSDIKRLKIKTDYDLAKVEVFVSEYIDRIKCKADDDTPSEVILDDPSTQELEDNGCSQPKDQEDIPDPGYDAVGDIEPTPVETYTGTTVSERQ